MSGESGVLAAGAVCWRIVDGEIRLLLIHRAQHADVSLPKGKADRGESLPHTAVREVAEETSLAVTLGVPLATTSYPLPSGGEKTVHYWAAWVDENQAVQLTFEPNAEVARLEWLSIAQARESLSYRCDADVLDSFAELVERGVERTFAIIVLRHGQAVPAELWHQSDSTRLIEERGAVEAAHACATIAAWGPRRLISSTATRCLATITPLAKLTHGSVSGTDAISQDEYDRGATQIRGVVDACIQSRKTTVLCSHAPVIREIVREIAVATGTPTSSRLDESTTLEPAGFSIFHLSHTHPNTGILAIETYDSDSSLSIHRRRERIDSRR